MIELAFDGMDEAAVTAQGDLALHVPGGQLRHRRPKSLEGVEGNRHSLETSFLKSADGRFGLKVEGRDRSRRLRIDPEVEWIVFAGSGDDWGSGVTVDQQGNVYVAGQSWSVDFPPGAGANAASGEAFVLKLTPEGAPVYSTFFGSASEADNANSVVVDVQGHAIVTGVTEGEITEVLPAHPGMCATEPSYTGFLAKLAVDGSSFQFSTCLPADTGTAVVIDPPTLNPPLGVTVVGSADSGNGDVFIGRYSLDGAGSAWQTWGGSKNDFPRDAAVDSAGRVFVVGWANSFDLPGTSGGLLPTATRASGFVARFARSGGLETATYLGGAGGMSGANGVAVDGSGNVVVTGWTQAADFPLQNASRSELREDPWGPITTAFVTKLLPSLGELVYSTFYAQDGVPVDGTIECVYGEEGVAVALDAAGKAYVVGQALTMNWDTYYEGVFAWLAVFDPAGQPAGNQLLDRTINGDQLYGIAVGPSGDIYLVGHVNYLWGSGASDSDLAIIRIPATQVDIRLLEVSRWKPQKDTTTPFEIVFSSSTPLASATVNIMGPSAVAPLIVTPPTPVTDFTVRWDGPWLTDPTNPASYLLAGDYVITVVGTTPGGEILESSPSDPKARVSLVEVKGVRLLHADGTEFEGLPDLDPAMPLTEAEASAATLTSTTPRAARLGGCIRVFAEAAVPGGEVEDKVLAEITTTAAMPIDVPVFLALKDVADPDSECAAGPMSLGDNNGSAPAPTSPVTVPGDTRTVRAEFRVSHLPGDNFRVVASTSPAWLEGVRAFCPSDTGEVRDAAGNVLGETGDQSQVSRVVTVWRTLHLEIDSMDPPPRKPSDPSWDERNFVTGEVKRFQGYRDGIIRMILTPDPIPGMTGLADDSLDLDSGGKGRFAWGQLRLNEELGDVPDFHFVGGNGIERVEAPSGNNFRVPFRVLDSADNELCRGTVQESAPPGGIYEVCPKPSECWPSAETAGTTLSIDSPNGLSSPVYLPISPGGVGPLATSDPLGFLLGQVLVSTSTLRFRLTDDDRAVHPFPVDTSLLREVDDPKENVFAAAYIRPHVLAKGDPPGYEQEKTPKFMRNIDTEDLPSGGCLSPQMDAAVAQGREAFSSPEYWAAYLVGAFQGPEAEDGDPMLEPRTTGLGDVHGSSALIFHETLLDGGIGSCARETPAHELGHNFGLPGTKDAGGMMDGCSRQQPRTYFLPEHVRTIRKGGIR